jgi:hypothetical protein
MNRYIGGLCFSCAPECIKRSHGFAAHTRTIYSFVVLFIRAHLTPFSIYRACTAAAIIMRNVCTLFVRCMTCANEQNTRSLFCIYFYRPTQTVFTINYVILHIYIYGYVWGNYDKKAKSEYDGTIRRRRAQLRCKICWRSIEMDIILSGRKKKNTYTIYRMYANTTHAPTYIIRIAVRIYIVYFYDQWDVLCPTAERRSGSK